MAIAYYASRISQNLAITPEKYLIAAAVVIARTGWMTYTVGDLPKEDALAMGLDISDPTAKIDLYRSEEDVFAPETLASFEGKPITDDHPPKFVDSGNFLDYICGHIQKVRRGDEALESGDWPLVADLLIQDKDLIEKILNNTVRELSCGYKFQIARDGDRILQTNLVGNHVAVVKKGRAGSEVRINDADTVITGPVIDPPTITPATPNKETGMKKNGIWKTLFGAGLRAMASDSTVTNEQLSDAAVLALDGEPKEEKKDEPVVDSTAKDAMKKADDAMAKADAAEKKADDAMKKAADMKAAAADAACTPGEEGHKSCTADKCTAKDTKAKDKKAADAAAARDTVRAKHHATLDRVMDEMGMGEEDEPEAAEDEDVNALGDMFGEYLKKKTGEDADPDDDESDIIEPVGEDKEDLVPANDALPILEPVIGRSKDAAVRKAFDSAPLDDEIDFLRHMRPSVARTKDRAVRQAFDAAQRKVCRVSRPSAGSYHSFAGAVGTARAKDSAGNSGRVDLEKLQSVYDDARNGK